MVGPESTQCPWHTVEFSESWLLKCLLAQKDRLEKRQEIQGWSPDAYSEAAVLFDWVSASEALSVPTPSLNRLDIFGRPCNPPTNRVHSVTRLKVHLLLHRPRSTCSVVVNGLLFPSIWAVNKHQQSSKYLIRCSLLKQGTLQEGQFFRIRIYGKGVLCLKFLLTSRLKENHHLNERRQLDPARPHLESSL